MKGKWTSEKDNKSVSLKTYPHRLLGPVTILEGIVLKPSKNSNIRKMNSQDNTFPVIP